MCVCPFVWIEKKKSEKLQKQQQEEEPGENPLPMNYRFIAIQIFSRQQKLAFMIECMCVHF